MTDIQGAAKRFELADRHWAEELRKQYGKRACDARYDPKRNRSTLALRVAHDLREEARADWERVAFDQAHVAA